jgi:SAM-dependent methyltransferase
MAMPPREYRVGRSTEVTRRAVDSDEPNGTGSRDADAGVRPLLTTFRPAWLGELALKGDVRPFRTLPPIADLVDEKRLGAAAVQAAIAEDVATYAARDRCPLPLGEDREGYYGDNHAGYWASGLSDYLKVRKASGRAGIDLDRARYFELGCASGRVLRHLACQSDAEVWGGDLNGRHIEWMRLFLPPKIKIFQNLVLPTLPLEACSFDVVTAFSVFTHIDDFELAWLAELRRILRPGGLGYITVSTEDTWESYKQGWIKDTLLPLADVITEYDVTEALFEGALPRDKTVFWWPVRNIYNASVFHRRAYIEREWSRFFTVEGIERNGHAYQDVVLLRRPVGS